MKKFIAVSTLAVILALGLSPLGRECGSAFAAVIPRRVESSSLTALMAGDDEPYWTTGLAQPHCGVVAQNRLWIMGTVLVIGLAAVIFLTPSKSAEAKG